MRSDEPGSADRMRRYCLGFAFDHALEFVLLLRKSKPDWQRGLLNGIGGHVEEGEEQANAMLREASEEAGILIPWIWCCQLDGIGTKQYRMHVYAATVAREELYESAAHFDCDEGTLMVYPVGYPLPPHINNLEWLIPFCQQRLAGVMDYKVTTL